MVVLAQWGAQERQNWPGAQECETPSYPSSCFKTESEKFNSVLDSILMFGGSQTGLLENHEMNSFVLMIDLDLDLCPYTIVHVTQINFWGSIYRGFNALRKRVMYRNRCLTTRALDPHRVSFRELTARAIPH